MRQQVRARPGTRCEQGVLPDSPAGGAEPIQAAGLLRMQEFAAPRTSSARNRIAQAGRSTGRHGRPCGGYNFRRQLQRRPDPNRRGGGSNPADARRASPGRTGCAATPTRGCRSSPPGCSGSAVHSWSFQRNHCRGAGCPRADGAGRSGRGPTRFRRQGAWPDARNAGPERTSAATRSRTGSPTWSLRQSSVRLNRRARNRASVDAGKARARSAHRGRQARRVRSIPPGPADPCPGRRLRRTPVCDRIGWVWPGLIGGAPGSPSDCGGRGRGLHGRAMCGAEDESVERRGRCSRSSVHGAGRDARGELARCA